MFHLEAGFSSLKENERKSKGVTNSVSPALEAVSGRCSNVEFWSGFHNIHFEQNRPGLIDSHYFLL